jgi:Ribbon-helix-helix domain
MKEASGVVPMETVKQDEVATHVLIPVTIAERLRELSRQTRVTQSEYLREAVVDLLVKYELTAQVVSHPADPGALEGNKPNG